MHQNFILLSEMILFLMTMGTLITGTVFIYNSNIIGFYECTHDDYTCDIENIVNEQIKEHDNDIGVMLIKMYVITMTLCTCIYLYANRMYYPRESL